MPSTRRGAVRARLALLLFAGLAAGACDNATEPVPGAERVAGSYLADSGFGALTLTTTMNGETVDWLAAGARIELALRSDGSTAGTLFIPGGDEDGGDFDADLAGVWTLQGDTLRLSHAADTFLRDMPLAVRNDRLEGDATFGGVRVRLTLVRR